MRRRVLDSARRVPLPKFAVFVVGKILWLLKWHRYGNLESRCGPAEAVALVHFDRKGGDVLEVA